MVQGSTLEVARSHGEGLDDFDWRVSIADVKTAGTIFSFYGAAAYHWCTRGGWAYFTCR